MYVDDLRQLILSFYYVVLGLELKAPGLGPGAFLYPLGRLDSSSGVILM